MALVDRYTRHALWMAAFQIAVFLMMLAYALLPPSLGSHVLAPGALMVLAFAGLVWITLNHPWDLEWQYAGSGTPLHRRWWLWDPMFLVAATLGMARGYGVTFAWGKEQLVRLREATGDSLNPWETLRAQELHEAWNADPFGALMVQWPQNVGTVIIPLVILAFLWVFLR